MHTKYTSSFRIFPEHTNHMAPCIFGGAFFSEMDLAAANCVYRALYSSKCQGAVTHKANVTFHKPTYQGDLIFIEAEIKDCNHKSIVVDTKAYRESEDSERELVAEVEFVFITIETTECMKDKPNRLPYKGHGLNLES